MLIGELSKIMILDILIYRVWNEISEDRKQIVSTI